MNTLHTHIPNSDTISEEKIIWIIDIFRTFHKKSNLNNQFEEIGQHILSQQIKHFKNNEQLQFLLPWFPCKSPNTKDKVLWHLPDKWEEIAIDRLQDFCEQVWTLHTPWAKITIASDGRVFNDIIGVSDQHVDHYKQELLCMVSKPLINILWLEDLLWWMEKNDVRQIFDIQFCNSPEIIEQKIHHNDDIKKLFLWLKKFLSDDMPSNKDISNSQRERIIKQKAKDVLRRSLWFDVLLSQILPNHIRLSVHPHSTSNGKFGFNLISNTDNRWTPRHNVVVESWSKILLMKKRDAEAMWCILEFKNWRQWWFVK